MQLVWLHFELQFITSQMDPMHFDKARCLGSKIKAQGPGAWVKFRMQTSLSWLRARAWEVPGQWPGSLGHSGIKGQSSKLKCDIRRLLAKALSSRCWFWHLSPKHCKTLMKTMKSIKIKTRIGSISIFLFMWNSFLKHLIYEKLWFSHFGYLGVGIWSQNLAKGLWNSWIL